MTEAELAKRFHTYLDALAAFSVVNTYAFIASMGDPDVGQTLGGHPFVIFGAAFGAILQSGALVALRRVEQHLLTEAGEPQTPLVERISEVSQWCRHGLVVVSMCVTLAVAFAAGR